MEISPKLNEYINELRFNASTELNIANDFAASVLAFKQEDGPPPGYVPVMIRNRRPGAVNRYGNQMYRPGVPAVIAAIADSVNNAATGVENFDLAELARTKPLLLDHTFEAIIVRYADYFTKHFGVELVKLARDRLQAVIGFI